MTWYVCCWWLIINHFCRYQLNWMRQKCIWFITWNFQFERRSCHELKTFENSFFLRYAELWKLGWTSKLCSFFFFKNVYFQNNKGFLWFLRIEIKTLKAMYFKWFLYIIFRSSHRTIYVCFHCIAIETIPTCKYGDAIVYMRDIHGYNNATLFSFCSPIEFHFVFISISIKQKFNCWH